MTLVPRPFTWKDDFELVRAFLIRTYNAANPFQNWIPSRFENIKFGPCGSEYRDEEDENIKIWQTADDQAMRSVSTMVAVTICQPSGDCWIQVHPDHRPDEREMVLWIETQGRQRRREAHVDSELRFYVDETDEARKTVLATCGFENAGFLECNRMRPVDQPVPGYQLPEGFTIRSVDLKEDFVRYRTVQSAVFPHCSDMSERTAEIYSTASFYRKDLDVVAVDPQGNFAAFCTVRIDPVSRMAELEPVGTHPDYRQLGLARSVICEGLRRLEKYNPSLICIQRAAATEAANRLYDSIGFTIKTRVHLWRKRL